MHGRAARPPLPLLSPSRFFWKLFQKSERFSATFCGGSGWPFWGSASGASGVGAEASWSPGIRGTIAPGGNGSSPSKSGGRGRPAGAVCGAGAAAGVSSTTGVPSGLRKRKRYWQCGPGSPSPHWREWRSRLSGVQTGIQGNGSAQGTSKGKSYIALNI